MVRFALIVLNVGTWAIFAELEVSCTLRYDDIAEGDGVPVGGIY